MSAAGRSELARARSLEYRRARKKRKTAILDEFVASTGVSRKTAIGLLRKPPPTAPRPRGRPRRRYGPDVAAALEMVWATSGYLCSKRLVPALRTLVPMIEAEGAWGFSEEAKAKLFRLSVSTCERLLHPSKAALQPAGRSMTHPGSMLKAQIPVRTWADWSETGPGYCEMDLVHHCGDEGSGEYLHTLTVTDVHLGWTAMRALKNRAEATVKCGLESIVKGMPYPVKGLDSDCGGEFINAIVYRYCTERNILFTRARANEKNDQCRVEQKNDSVVRRNVGYDRFEGDEATRSLNALYRALELRVNFLQPCMILTGKERIGGKVRRRYGAPMTPCDRALQHPAVSDENKARLRDRLKEIRPVALAKDILRLREALRHHAR